MTSDLVFSLMLSAIGKHYLIDSVINKEKLVKEKRCWGNQTQETSSKVYDRDSVLIEYFFFFFFAVSCYFCEALTSTWKISSNWACF